MQPSVVSSLTVAEIQSRLALIPPEQRCQPKCKGWFVGARKIERRDDCINKIPAHLRLFDEDLALLPEAQAAFALEFE